MMGHYTTRACFVFHLPGSLIKTCHIAGAEPRTRSAAVAGGRSARARAAGVGHENRNAAAGRTGDTEDGLIRIIGTNCRSSSETGPTMTGN